MREGAQTPDIIVIGASAGGVEALQQIVSGLPPDLPAALFVALHLPAGGVSHLPDILSRHGPLPALHAQDGHRIKHGFIYVAPPNQHLLLHDGRIQLGAGPKENRHRPAVNVLFRSAAWTYGPRVIGVVLSGALDDGTSGLWEIKQRGGKAIVQDPSEALFPDMPQHAKDNVSIDYVVPLRDIATLLTDLAGQPVIVPDEKARQSMKIQSSRTDLTCPECRGPISEFAQGPMKEYRCRVGHRYSPESFLAYHAETRERILWAAVVALEEGSDMASDLARRGVAGAPHLKREAQNTASAAATIRELLTSLSRETSRHLMDKTDMSVPSQSASPQS